MIAGDAHHRAAIVDLDVVCFRQVEFGLLCRDAELELLHHLAVFGPADMLFIVIAHGPSCRTIANRMRDEEPWACPGGTGLSASLKPRLRRVFTLRASIPHASEERLRNKVLVVGYSVGFQITANSSSLSDPAARPRLANSLRGPNSGAEIEIDT